MSINIYFIFLKAWLSGDPITGDLVVMIFLKEKLNAKLVFRSFSTSQSHAAIVRVFPV